MFVLIEVVGGKVLCFCAKTTNRAASEDVGSCGAWERRRLDLVAPHFCQRVEGDRVGGVVAGAVRGAVRGGVVLSALHT